MKTISYHRVLASSIILLFSLLACRPVFAIGWTELIILMIIIAFLLGPYLLKLYRTYDKIKKAGQDEEKGN
jgi:uncharacterized membrane protein